MDWLNSLDIPTLLEYLYNPFVLLVLGILFITFLKLKRKALAAIILGLVGYYHVFQVLPARTGDSASDLNNFLTLMGYQEFLIFLGGIIITTFGSGYIIFKK